MAALGIRTVAAPLELGRGGDAARGPAHAAGSELYEAGAIGRALQSLVVAVR